MALVPYDDSDSDDSVTTNTPQKRQNVSKGKAVVYVDLPAQGDSEEEEDNDRKPKRTRVTKGVGLADLLPAPKHNKPMRERLDTTKTLTPASIVRKLKEKKKEAVVAKEEEEVVVEKEEENIPTAFKGSFFHIGKELNQLKEDPPIKAIKQPTQTKTASVAPMEPVQTIVTAADAYAYDPNAMYSYGADPSLFQQQYDYVNEDELEKVVGRRIKGEANIQIKEIKQEDILPSDEWRAQQAMTAAPVFEHQTMAASKLQMKKNNIMALAAQAVNNQEKLENMYAAQKKTRREAQQKYGF